jgi:UDP-N-acetylmuramoyl-tripeptide--D-alanyl-D-alanine ligase
MKTANLYSVFLNSKGACTDTRKLKKGELFFALSGENFNGNDYAQQAIKKGALAAVVDQSSSTSNNSKFLKVTNVLDTLQSLSRYHRKQLNLPVIGLTGSNGKTTSKEVLVSVLQQKFKVGYTRGNLNNHIGVPLSLLSLTKRDEMAVIEMGANHQKEIEFLSNLCLPTHGFITNYGKAHLEGFGGVEGVIKGKSELYEHLRKNRQKAWVNCKDEKQLEKSEGIDRFTFGNCTRAHYPVFDKGVDKTGLLHVQLKDGTHVKTNLTGIYNFSNVAIAAALGQYFGLSFIAIKKGIESYQPSNNRSQLSMGKNNRLVKDYYNANPSSMKAALENFGRIQAKSKWVILGDMFELGQAATKEHQAISLECEGLELEKTILVGSNFKAAATIGQIAFSNNTEVAEYLQKVKPKNKTILIKGSRGMHLEKAAELL